MAKAAKEKKPVGRPETTQEEIDARCDKAKEYLIDGWKSVGDVMPTIAGLACYIGVSRETIYKWSKDNVNFSDILDSIMAFQENQLVNRGLDGTFNSTITKLMLTKHGYSDKVEQDIKADIAGLAPIVIAPYDDTEA